MTRHKILIPLDGSEFSEQILPTIRNFFDPEECELILLRVAPPPHGIEVTPPPVLTAAWPYTMHPPQRVEPALHPISAAQLEESVRGTLQDELLSVKYRLQEHGYEVTTVVRFGEAAREIVDFAEYAGVDLVAMVTHGRTGLMHLLLGSVAERVLRHLAKPLLLLRPVHAPVADRNTVAQFVEVGEID